MDGLVVAYGQRTVVDGVSFAVREGEVFGLLGPNGAGKTTTLRVVEGLLPALQGRVRVDGVDVSRSVMAARARIGVQLQSAALPPELTLTEILMLFSALHGRRISAADARRQLADAGLGDAQSLRASQVSGGQRQRLALAVAFVHDPRLAILDEPTTGLDPRARRGLWELVTRRRREGRGVLLTTHSMEEAQALSDRIAIMHHGRILAEDTPPALVANFAADPRVRAIAHGAPTLEDVFLALTGAEVRS